MKYYSKTSADTLCLKFICDTGKELIRITIVENDDRLLIDANYDFVTKVSDGYILSDRETFNEARQVAEDFISSFGEPVSFVGSRPVKKPGI